MRSVNLDKNDKTQNLTDETRYSYLQTPIIYIPPIGRDKEARDNKQNAELSAKYLSDIFTPNQMQEKNNLPIIYK